MSGVMLGRVNLGSLNIRWSLVGGRLRVTGTTSYGLKKVVEDVRQQLTGYVDSPDEPFVPFLWDEEPTLTGYWRVLAATVDAADWTAYFGLVRWSIELERVSGFAAPLIELRRLAAARAATESANETPLNVIVVPGSARSVGFFSEDLGVWIPFNPDLVRDTVDGSVKVYEMPSFHYLTQYYVSPAAFYEGAATLLMGDQLSPVVGRQVRNQPGAWRLSNGLYEIEPTGNLFELRHRMWLDGAWTDWVPFMFWSSEGVSGRQPMPAPHSITVLRNTPTEVTIRLLTTANGEYSPVTVDVSLKRGWRNVGVELRSVFVSRFAVQCATVTWEQDEAWYVWDAVGGVRHFIASNQTIALVSGGGVVPSELAVTSVDRWSFTLGATDDAFVDPIDTHIRSWFWAGSEKQAVVSQ